jgi:hypothetical protein
MQSNLTLSFDSLSKAKLACLQQHILCLHLNHPQIPVMLDQRRHWRKDPVWGMAGVREGFQMVKEDLGCAASGLEFWV